ncbi:MULTISPECIES: hypothetical protein [Streptomyces]|uniref:DUF2304 domain-containing protein n=2 Tax=Streptomyces TaxID=1883 RepID=A0ABQ2ZTJ1_9ACTN|nr:MULTISPECIES: hypothetical protein [Streptomyces]MBX7465223.1 hypothetical protein [Streptomyces sp. MAG02]MYV92388.1 hypothetical protein [Streptomyces sp. SID1034]GGY25184.1 hypothetical protein GCM10010326_18690 [Streptomyces xanthochromogenes]GHB25780.1 hypothetical protein GCM10010331_09740 [Streptomyces xanthochromogenes]
MPSLHFPVMLALAAGAFFLLRKGGTKLSHALICAGFGFYLADTAVAPSLHTALNSVTGMLGQLG